MKDLPFKNGDRVLCADRTDDNRLELIRGVVVKVYPSVPEPKWFDDYKALVRLEAPHLEGDYTLISLFVDDSAESYEFGTL
jgi:hypothetical protein